MISLAALNKTYWTGDRGLHVLKDLDLEIATGESVAIMGSSGSGKSTLLNIIGLLDGYDTGTYRLDGQVMQGLSESQAATLRSTHLGFVFQSFNLLPYKDAVENVALPLFYQGVSRRMRRERALAALESMGLADWHDHLPNQLSGGQKQRVAIARALVTEPKVVLADEPTGALDGQTTEEILEVLEGVHAKGMTLVVVTHEDDVGARMQRVVRLRDGRVDD
jgi:putative ABC transport system ATP-binding protein